MEVQERSKQTRGAVVAEVIRTRRSIQLFAPEPVPPRDVVRRAIDLARWAPNHRLTEPWRFYLLGPETARAVAELNAAMVTQERGDAAGRNKRERWLAIPGWLVVTRVNADDPLRAQEDYAACACAVQNIQLYLWSEGVGTKWTTGAVTRDPRFYECIGVDPGAETAVGLVWYGYPAEVPQPPPRRPVADVLSERP